MASFALTSSYLISWTTCAGSTGSFDSTCATTGGTESSTDTTSQTLITSMPSPAIVTPLATPRNGDGSVADSGLPLGNSVTVTGSASTLSVDSSTVTVFAFNQRWDNIGWCGCLGSPSVPLVSNPSYFQSWAAQASAKVTVPVTNGNFATTLNLPNGSYDLVVTQSDTGGHLGVSAPDSVVVDTSGPAISISWPPQGTTEPSAFVGLSIARGWGGTSQGTPSAQIAYYAGTSATGTPVVTDTVGGCATCSTQLGDAPVGLGTGTWTAVVTAANHSGVSSTSTVHFSVDAASAVRQPTTLKFFNSSGGLFGTQSNAGPNVVVVAVTTGSGGPDSPTVTGRVELTVSTDGQPDQNFAGVLSGGTARFTVNLPSAYLTPGSITSTTFQAKFWPGAGFAVTGGLLTTSPFPLLPSTLSITPSFPGTTDSLGSLIIRETAPGADGAVQSCAPHLVRWVDRRRGGWPRHHSSTARGIPPVPSSRPRLRSLPTNWVSRPSR